MGNGMNHNPSQPIQPMVSFRGECIANINLKIASNPILTETIKSVIFFSLFWYIIHVGMNRFQLIIWKNVVRA
jgi:hypothetical protein